MLKKLSVTKKKPPKFKKGSVIGGSSSVFSTAAAFILPGGSQSYETISSSRSHLESGNLISESSMNEMSGINRMNMEDSKINEILPSSQSCLESYNEIPVMPSIINRKLNNDSHIYSEINVKPEPSTTKNENAISEPKVMKVPIYSSPLKKNSHAMKSHSHQDNVSGPEGIQLRDIQSDIENLKEEMKELKFNLCGERSYLHSHQKQKIRNLHERSGKEKEEHFSKDTNVNIIRSKLEPCNSHRDEYHLDEKLHDLEQNALLLEHSVKCINSNVRNNFSSNTDNYLENINEELSHLKLTIKGLEIKTADMVPRQTFDDTSSQCLKLLNELSSKHKAAEDFYKLKMKESEDEKAKLQAQISSLKSQLSIQNNNVPEILKLLRSINEKMNSYSIIQQQYSHRQKMITFNEMIEKNINVQALIQKLCNQLLNDYIPVKN